MNARRSHIIWAKTESELRQLQAVGWQAEPYHHFPAQGIEMRYCGRGEPRLPGHPQVRA